MDFVELVRMKAKNEHDVGGKIIFHELTKLITAFVMSVKKYVY